MNWVMTYGLACGCIVAHVHTNERNKRVVGDTWVCDEHGRQTIDHAEGVTS